MTDGIGNLKYVFMDDIDPSDSTQAAPFLINAAAHYLQHWGQNYIPVIVKEIRPGRYQVIANSFVFAVAELAGLERIWCLVTQDQTGVETIAQVLAQEQTPKLNLSTASRDEIKEALEYLSQRPGSPLSRLNVLVATSRIDESPRQYWKNLEPITTLKCGITKGTKLKALEQIFYLTPQPLPEVIQDPIILRSLPIADLKKIAKNRGLTGYSKMKKTELIDQLSQKTLVPNNATITEMKQLSQSEAKS